MIKSEGITNIPNTVPNNIPPIALIPMDLLPTAPAPVAIANGSNPKIKANEVIKIGRKRAVAPSTADFTMLIP